MLEFEPVGPFGVRVHGLAQGGRPDIGQRAKLRQALSDHRFLLFRGQTFSEEDHVALVSAIGQVQTENGYLVNYLNARASAYIKSDAVARERYLYHADYQMLPRGPLQVISLYGVKVDEANPTLFADMVGAERRLSGKLRGWLENTANFQLPYHEREDRDVRFRVSARTTGIPPFKIPSIRRHAKTGERYISVSEYFTSHFDGLSESDSDPWFAALGKVQYDPEHAYIHRWQERDLLIFDNEALQHARAQITGAMERSLRRVVANPQTMDELLSDLGAFSTIYQ